MPTDDPAPSSRIQAGLLAGGAGVLLVRTVVMVAGGARRVLRPWVVALTYVEMAVDAVTMGAAARWWWTRSPRHASTAFRAAATATVLHAVRVAIYVLGRTGPRKDFDVRPEARADHDERWTWGQVVFAGAAATAGLAGAAVIWRRRAHRRAA